MNWRLGGIFLLVLLGMAHAYPCGPSFPDGYIVYGGRSVFELPPLSVESEIAHVLSLPDKPPEDANASQNGLDELEAVRAPVRKTAEVDVAELEAALRELGVNEADAKTMLSDYSALRAKLTEIGIAAAEAFAQVHFWYYTTGKDFKPASELAEALDLAAYEPVLQRIPQEFAEYARGSAAFYKGQLDAAVSHWQAVLSLPPAQRTHRTLWATFMLGRMKAENDAAAAAECFAQCRKMISDGTPDPLGLAGDSLGWLARMETRTKRYVEAIHHYAELAEMPSHSHAAVLSLTTVCSHLLAEESIDPALAKDSLCSRIVTAAMACQYGNATKWAQCIEAAQIQPPVQGADRVAWNAYKRGDVPGAAEWLKKADMSTVYAQWVRAKLLLRDGKIEEGESVLNEAERLLDQGGERIPQLESLDYFRAESARERIAGDIGVTYLHDHAYAEALAAFVRGANCFPDAIYVAECVMSVDELKAFLQNHKDDATLDARLDGGASKGVDQGVYIGSDERLHSKREVIQHVCAARLADQGKWEEALPFFPEPLKAEATKAAELAHDGASRSGRARAEKLIELGALLRTRGIALTGRYLMPDWSIVEGAYDLGDWDSQRWFSEGKGLEGATDDEKARVERSRCEPNKRFHYRYKAADLMWQAASLLPNNDLLTAKALYDGGRFVERRDPGAADRFYKALVRRNPNLEIGQQAKTLHWFPAKFSDKVLYHPRPFWSKRKAAMAACAGLLSAAGVVLLGWRFFGRKTVAANWLQ